MKKILLAIVSILTITACSNSSSGAITSVDAPTFLSKISQPGVQIIDVRTPEEFAAGHLVGAINIDVNGSTFADSLAALDKNGTYALYCRSGNRSTIASGKMADAGFSNIINFNKGGFVELANAGAPTE